MSIWEFIYDKIKASSPVMLLCVLESKGSSPGRQGFKMAVSGDGDFTGTIGGGIMEFKLVEKAKSLLNKKETNVSVVHQFHDKEHAANQSGMICSGSQVIAFVPLNESQLTLLDEIKQYSESHEYSFQLSPAGLSLTNTAQSFYEYENDNSWQYAEPFRQQQVIHIIGGGHVSLALSEQMKWLGFYVKVYDDRTELNTLEQNSFADEKLLVEYEEISDRLVIGLYDFVVIMTIGYRTDKIVLKQLLDRNIYYLGMLGSENKIKAMFTELIKEGINEEQLKKIFTPIGINIFSQTTKEIAVSIAAEIIKEKNKFLPTGRKKD
ncbi:MAG: XdhC family protein [Sphingobacteriales bacterium]|nr:XdhC family protein [Sphingobacteriales bacterium]MBI3718294.1 XdhC family protein [Sphingobacteriales bacterium]